MPSRDLVRFILLPLILLAAAWQLHSHQLWSVVASMTLAWLLSAIAIAMMLLGCVCTLLAVEPGQVPEFVMILFIACVMGLLGIGMIIDGNAPYGRGDYTAASIGGWLGFGCVLTGVFILPRMDRPVSNRSKKSTARESTDL